MDLKIAPSSAELADLRNAARRELDGLPDEVVHEVLLALDEAVANAIRYGSAAGQPIEVALSVRGDWIDLSVRDRGPTAWLPTLPSQPPPPLATGGRGLWLILQLADEVLIERAGAGTRLAVRRRAEARARAGTR